MGKRKRKARKNQYTMGAPKSAVKLAPAPWLGDHGTGTAAANLNTLLEPLKNYPDRRARRRRVDNVTRLLGRLTAGQYTMAVAIQHAMAKREQLSSGSPIKEKVDSCPDPTAPAAALEQATSDLRRYTDHLLRSERALVGAICGEEHWSEVQLAATFPRWLFRFRVAMERVGRNL